MAEHHHHDHRHGDGPGHAHERQRAARSLRKLGLALGLTFGFAGVEAVFGWLAGSLALISDAGHMLSDSVALALAIAAAWLATRPPSNRHSYGLARAEVIAAALNGLTLLALTAWIVYEALIRIREPQPVAGATVMVVAAIGLLMNLFLARQLAHQHDDLNLRAVFLHVISDLLGSVAALVAGTVVWLTGWTPIDPLLSILAAGLILASAIRVLRDALNVLMEGVPRGIDLEAVGRALAGIPTVRAVHDLHVWTLASGTAALSAHIEIAGMDAWPQILREARRVMREQFGISHITLQPELVPSLRPRGGKVIPIRERPGRGG